MTSIGQVSTPIQSSTTSTGEEEGASQEKIGTPLRNAGKSHSLQRTMGRSEELTMKIY